MLRCVFVGSPNRFTELIVHWLAEHCDLRGVVWTYSAHWAKTFSGRIQFAKKRVNRFGVLKAVDEALYYLVSKNFLNETGEPFQSRLCEAYARQYEYSEWRGAAIETDDINSPEVTQFVRRRCPDLIMAMCINEFFRKEIRELPRLGSFLWHEGLVPEYKGLYSPFWAIHNGEPEMLGYTVLRMNGRYDEGEVYLQGRVAEVNPQSDSPVYIGHKAILDSLPDVAKMFESLENGAARPITLPSRRAATYSYPGLSDWVRFRLQIRRLGLQERKDPQLDSPLPAESVKDQG